MRLCEEGSLYRDGKENASCLDPCVDEILCTQVQPASDLQALQHAACIEPAGAGSMRLSSQNGLLGPT